MDGQVKIVTTQGSGIDAMNKKLMKIAERYFKVEGMSDDYVCKVTVSRPQQSLADSNEWECVVSTIDGEHSQKRKISGIDSLQVLMMALKLVEVESETLGVKYGAKITFLGQSNLVI